MFKFFFAQIFLLFKGFNNKVYRGYLFLLGGKHIVSIANTENSFYFYLSIPHKDIVDLRFIFSQNITLNENIRIIPGPKLKIRTNEKAIPNP